MSQFSDIKPSWCMGCPLYEAPGPVFAQPPRPAAILLLGEAPGRDEVQLNKNFIGGAGRVLRTWLRQTGLDIDECEVRNVVKCRPTTEGASGKPIDRAPTEAEIRHCAHFLAEELATIRPNLIVALGATALYVSTGCSPISAYRGRILEGPALRPLQKPTPSPLHKEGQVNATQTAGEACKVLPVYHPAFIMRQQELWPLAVHDLARAKVEGQFREIRQHKTYYTTTGSLPYHAAEFTALARAAGYVVFDLEAEGIVRHKNKGLDLGTGQITVMGLTTRPYEAHALHFTPDTQQLCHELFNDPAVEKVTQNGEGFDIPYCEHRSFNFAGPSFDTLQAFHLTNSDLEKNLDFIASLYAADIPPWKGDAMYKSGFDALKLGNCKDVDATCRAYLSLRDELRNLDMHDLYYKSVMPLQPVLRKMTARGLRQNEAQAHKMSFGARRLAKELEEKIKRVIGFDVNLDSPQQLRKLLYDTMGLPTQYKKDKKRGQIPTVDDNALDELAKVTAQPIFALIHKRRKVLKLDSTYLQTEPDDAGFVHYHIGSAKAAEKGEKGSGARNGRLISWSPNFQNQPLEVRELYIPDTPEHVLIEADWSQIEWRLAMVLAGEPFGLELLSQNVDNHTTVAAECFELPIAEVLRRDAEAGGGWGSPRFETKFIVYGLGYGRGATDIAKQLGRDITWVERFIQRFRTRFPIYWRWRDSLERQVSKDSYLRNAFGRRRWWYTRQVTEMYNFPPSSTAADMMYLILPQLERELPHEALRLTVHDSILLSVPKDLAKTAADTLRGVMHQHWRNIVEYSDRPNTVRHYYPDGWFCPCDVHVGLNWRECKKGNKQLTQYLNITEA